MLTRPVFGQRLNRDRARKEDLRSRGSYLMIVKPTPFWDELECGGIPGEGYGGVADLGPSFAAQKGPLFQDDSWRRGDLAPRNLTKIG
jgi:hypothetical protein